VVTNLHITGLKAGANESAPRVHISSNLRGKAVQMDDASSAVEVLRRLRRFLLALSIVLFLGALTELWLVAHTQDVVQWLAFVFAIIGGVSALLVLLKLNGTTIRLMRVCMFVVLAGSLFGIYQHISGNIAFEREIRPNSSTNRLISRGLRGGNPLLAPGVLAVAAVLALGATHRAAIDRSH
jgi:predicted CDP-diglyceride synthetase/phosphatidate cytidylyltransferase